LLIERSKPLTRFGSVRAGTVFLQVGRECRGSFRAYRISPGLLVRLFAGLLVERGETLARLGDVRA
jgi:hypothetical protein